MDSAKRKKHEFECDECGIIHGHSAMCTKRSETITISRKVAEEWLKHVPIGYDSEYQMAQEVKLALSKEGK